MAYMIVFAAALVTGALVYWLTLRAGRASRSTPRSRAAAGSCPNRPRRRRLQLRHRRTRRRRRTAGPTCRSASDRRSWQTRTVGVLGLLIAVTLAAALLAFSLYQGGSLVANLINDYAS